MKRFAMHVRVNVRRVRTIPSRGICRLDIATRVALDPLFEPTLPESDEVDVMSFSGKRLSEAVHACVAVGRREEMRGANQKSHAALPLPRESKRTRSTQSCAAQPTRQAATNYTMTR